MLTQSLQLLAAVVVVLVPGLSVLVALGVRDRLWWAAMAAPVTLGLILVTSVLTGITGIPFSAYAVIGVLIITLAASLTVRRLILHRNGPLVPPAEEHTDGSLTGYSLRAAQLTGLLFMLVGMGLAVFTWRRALGTWATPSQEHDPITHSVLTAYIHFTGKAAPWQLAPADIVSGQPITFYPPGFPQLSAVITDLTGGHPIVGMNLATVAVLAVVWPLSAGTLAAAVARIAGRNQGWTHLAGGVAALIAAVLYKPTISLPHDGGVLPQAVACALVPGVLAAMLTVRKRHWLGAVLIGIAVAGTMSAHSSALASIAFTGIAAAAGLLCTRDGRTRLKEIALPLVVAAGLAVVMLLPVLLGSAAQGASVASHPADIPPQTLHTAVNSTLGLTYWGFLDPEGNISQVALGVLTGSGAIAVLLFRRGLPLLTAWLFWVAVVINFQVAPTSKISSTIGAFYYQGFFRVETNLYLVVPALIGMGAVLVAGAVTHVARSWRFAPIAVVGAVLAVMAVLSGTTLSGYVDRNIDVLAARYRAPDIDRYDASDYAAIDWLHGHVRPGETIMNNGNDGSTLAYVEYGLPVINTTSMGAEFTAPYTVALLSRFNAYPTDPQIYKLLVDRNVRWVYVDSQAPIILADKRSWVRSDYYTLAPGLTDLGGLPGMSVAFRSGHVTVYRLDLGAAPATPPQPMTGRPPR